MPVPAAVTAVQTLSDEAIVPRILAGEPHLFEILMRRHNERVYRAARAILRDEREAEDVMQEAYVNAYAHLSQFDGRAKFSTWLTKIAVHEALGRARRQGRYESLEESTLETFMPGTSSPDPERQAFGRELGALIESAVDGLGDGYREVFMLRQVEGMSTAETADVLGVSEDVVKTRFSRARHAIQRDLLDRTGWDVRVGIGDDPPSSRRSVRIDDVDAILRGLSALPSVESAVAVRLADATVEGPAGEPAFAWLQGLSEAPRMPWTIDRGADPAAARYATWFGEPSRVELVQSGSDEVGDRLHVFYRLRVKRPGDAWKLIEQHLFCALDEGRVAAVDLVCSGFRPDAAQDPPVAE